MAYTLPPAEVRNAELELGRRADLLASLRRIRDPWDPGSPIAKLVVQLQEDIDCLAADLLKKTG